MGGSRKPSTPSSAYTRCSTPASTTAPKDRTMYRPSSAAPCRMTKSRGICVLERK